MSFSDPSLTPLGTTAATPKQQAQVKEVIMNSSMMYMHEVRTFHPEVSVTKKKNSRTEVLLSKVCPTLSICVTFHLYFFSLKT